MRYISLRQCQSCQSGQKNAKDSYQSLSRFNNLSNGDIDGLKQISPPKRPDFKAGTMVGWRDSHIYRADAPELINIPTVESVCKNRVLGLQTGLVKIQPDLKALCLLRDLQAAQKSRNITECCHAVLGESHTWFQT